MYLQCENDIKNGKIQYIDDDIIHNNIVYVNERSKIYKKNIEFSVVDKSNSYMVGDKWIDVIAGYKYGVKPIFVMSGEGYDT